MRSAEGEFSLASSAHPATPGESHSDPQDDTAIKIYGNVIIVTHVPASRELHATGGNARIEVRGDVGPGARLDVFGGGASIEVQGNVGEGAVLAASGGCAQVIVHGEVSSSAQIVARGARAMVRLEKPTSAQIIARGGNASIVRP